MLLRIGEFSENRHSDGRALPVGVSGTACARARRTRITFGSHESPCCSVLLRAAVQYASVTKRVTSPCLCVLCCDF